MAVTRSSVAERSRSSSAPPSRVDARTPELLWLLIASGLVCAGLALVYLGKTHVTPATTLDLRTIERREQLLPVLDMFRDAKDRQFAATRMFEFLSEHRNSIPNVGALSRLRARGD